MTQPIPRDAIYRRRVFDAEIIELCVRWYISYRLSYRDLVKMMAERGIQVAHTTILRWVLRYVPEYEKRWSRFARPVGTSWRVDETYISIRGRLPIAPGPRNCSSKSILSQSARNRRATSTAQDHARRTCSE